MKYADYIRSAAWRAKRQWALERAGHRCQVCNGTEKLEVHHRTYANLGAELPGDLIVLDERCHELYHRAGLLAAASSQAIEDEYDRTLQAMRDRAHRGDSAA